MSDIKQTIQIEQAIDIPSGKIRLKGELKLPQGAAATVNCRKAGAACTIRQGRGALHKKS